MECMIFKNILAFKDQSDDELAKRIKEPREEFSKFYLPDKKLLEFPESF